MNPNNSCNYACRHCQFYNPEGRRGGMCSLLGVSVKADWKSCSLASLAFQTQWESLPEIVLLEKSFSLGCATPQANLKAESMPIHPEESKISSEIMVYKKV